MHIHSIWRLWNTIYVFDNDVEAILLDGYEASSMWECLTAACKAFSLANAKEKGTDGLVIRSLDD